MERGESDPNTLQTVRAESRHEVCSIRADLERGDIPGTLGGLHRRHQFDAEQLTIVLLLLERRIHEARQTLTGREILAFLHESSFDRLRGLRHLAADQKLRKSGILEVLTDGSDQDLLECEIRLGEAVFRAIEKDVTPEVEAAEASRKRRRRPPYREHREHLLDLARLSRLYQRRARRVFESEEPEETLSQAAVKHLEEAIGKLRARIASRLTRAAEGDRFPIEILRRKHRLDEAEVLILVTLLFQEIYAGASYVESIELVKMVCGSDLELMERRFILSEEGRLVRSGLVRIAVTDETHPHVGGEAYLPPELVRQILSGPKPEGPIDADARIEWHEYLEGLGDSGEFFESL